MAMHGARLARILSALAWLLMWSSTPAQAQAPVRVGVVVQHADDRVATYCVALDEPNPTGYDALLATGQPLEASVSAQGVAICSIGETGCPAHDCFCQCRGAVCSYWAYFYLDGDAWQVSSVGAGGREVGHGNVEGWRWGAGDPPPVMTFDQICGEAAEPATQAPQPDRPAVSDTAIPPRAGRGLPLIAAAAAMGAAALALILSTRRNH